MLNPKHNQQEYKRFSTVRTSKATGTKTGRSSRALGGKRVKEPKLAHQDQHSGKGSWEGRRQLHQSAIDVSTYSPVTLSQNRRLRLQHKGNSSSMTSENQHYFSTINNKKERKRAPTEPQNCSKPNMTTISREDASGNGTERKGGAAAKTQECNRCSISISGSSQMEWLGERSQDRQQQQQIHLQNCNVTSLVQHLDLWLQIFIFGWSLTQRWNTFWTCLRCSLTAFSLSNPYTVNSANPSARLRIGSQIKSTNKGERRPRARPSSVHLQPFFDLVRIVRLLCSLYCAYSTPVFFCVCVNFLRIFSSAPKRRRTLKDTHNPPHAVSLSERAMLVLQTPRNQMFIL